MKVEIKEVKELLRELSVEVPAETVNSKMQEKYNDVRRKVTLKGYRKGKAPMDMIKSLYHDQVKADVAEEIIKDTYPEVIKEKTLRVASYPSVTNLNFADDGGLNYTATVEVFPEIKKVVYNKLELTSHEIETTDAEVDEVIEVILKRYSELRVVEREARKDDVIVLDIDNIYDPDNVLANKKFPDSEVDLSNKLTVKEFKEHLPGMKTGDVKEIEVQYDKDYPDKVFAGAHLKYKCKVKNVKERIMPELNDAFAKSTKEAETVLELRMKIRERLKSQKIDEQNREHKNQLIKQVCDKNQVPVPEALINEYLKNVVNDFKKQYKDVDETEIQKNYKQVGINSIRWNMLVHQLAKQETIEVTPSDTENLINKFAENYKITPEQAKETLHKSGNISDIKESLLEDKVVDFLLSKAKITKTDK